ncbi:PmoA family protein [Pontibacter sp. E15-1]|uniref:DUF6807 domain-containing protein n=1 Tax=Pontibacter sp. E15-1 TaxID=2919918 RepID=UPI001F4F7EFB|nr:PmoA family protein [Pontibacter sp. E15-1]MCJ8164966.1 PmoA family protein [Pontibacter sp. E15-1]
MAMGQAKTNRIQLTVNRKAKRVDVTIDGKPFTSYVYPEEVKKPVLYPIRTAKGTVVTRGWPLEPRPGERVDHPHHVGLWFNYGDVNGHDFWNNSNDTGDHKGPFGTIRHRRVDKMTSGNDQASLEVSAEWQKPDGTPLLVETTRFVFRGDGDTRTIDRITTLTAQKEDVLFKDNKEGLIALRVARELEHPSTKPEVFTDASGKATAVPQLNNEGVTGLYHSSKGITGDAVWGTRAEWVSLNGKIGKEPIAVVIMDNPQNVGFPTYWHARGYGLFAANPLGQQAMSEGKEELNFKLPAGESVTFRHRVLIHSGADFNTGQAETAYQRFIQKQSGVSKGK